LRSPSENVTLPCLAITQPDATHMPASEIDDIFSGKPTVKKVLTEATSSRDTVPLKGKKKKSKKVKEVEPAPEPSSSKKEKSSKSKEKSSGAPTEEAKAVTKKRKRSPPSVQEVVDPSLSVKRRKSEQTLSKKKSGRMIFRSSRTREEGVAVSPSLSHNVVI